MSKVGEVYSMMYVSAHAFFLNEKGETLVLQRCENNKYKPLKWDIPGGKLLCGEDVETALKREVSEETGLVVTKIYKPLSVFVNTEQIPLREDVQIVFQCDVLETTNIRIHTTEHLQYKWVRPEKLSGLDCMDYLKDFIKKVLS